MVAKSELEIIINGETKGAEGAFKKVGSALSSLAKVGVGAAIGGIAALGAGLAYSVKEAMAAEEIQAQLNAVLKSTGGAAGVTAEMANGLAESLSKVTRFEDDTVLSGENMLLTFTNIGKDIFPQATEAMLDMSTALGQDIKSSAIQLGKALNDPVQGITALQRVGVSFTDEQKKMVEGMVNAGDLMGAQTFILQELQKEFGGSAKAAGETFAGQLDILKNSLGNVAEGVGTALLPILQALLENVIMPLVPYIEAFAAGLSALFAEFQRGAEYGGLFNGVMEVLDNFLSEDLMNTLWDVYDWFQAKIPVALNTAGDWIGKLKDWWAANGDAILAKAKEVWDTVLQAITNFVAWITPIIQGFLAGLQAWWAENGDAIMAKAKETWDKVSKAITDFIAFIKPIIEFFLNAIRDFWAAHGDQIMATVGKMLAWLVLNFGTFLGNVAESVSLILASIKKFWDEHGEQIKATVQALWDAVVKIYNWFKDQVELLFAAFKAAQEGDWRTFGEKLREIIDNIWIAIKGLFKTAWDDIKMIVGNLIQDIKDKFQNTDWKAVGKGIMEGIVNGIKAGWDWVVQAAKNAAKAALDAAKGLLGIESPSKAFMEVGRNMMTGMAAGITGASNLPALATAGAAAGTMTTVNYYLTANYAYQSPGTLAQDIRLLEMLHT